GPCLWRTDNPVRPPERVSPRSALGWVHGLTDRIVRRPRILPMTAVFRQRSRAGSWRTDNPVRLPERVSPRSALGWVHGLTDRIVRPPRILPMTAIGSRKRSSHLVHKLPLPRIRQFRVRRALEGRE